MSDRCSDHDWIEYNCGRSFTRARYRAYNYVIHGILPFPVTTQDLGAKGGLTEFACFA
ncbi:hypothetical protein TWF694_007263 [Orbilia ellipsospora]|uniref:Uncharacterized protein n=1 Tax=Orbilia ellipsospora TaxID=2528407 RepID=A0AAV9XHQ0_9PEZI